MDKSDGTLKMDVKIFTSFRRVSCEQRRVKGMALCPLIESWLWGGQENKISLARRAKDKIKPTKQNTKSHLNSTNSVMRVFHWK